MYNTKNIHSIKLNRRTTAQIETKTEIKILLPDGTICQHGGTYLGDGKYRGCNCLEGFTGDKCQTDVDDCYGVICQNNGICQDGINSFSCNCRDGYTGEICDTHIADCIEVIMSEQWNMPSW